MFKIIPKSLFLLAFLVIILQLNSYAYDLTVAKDGSGNYTTVQAAINAAPANSIVPYTIYVKDGNYREKINIPATKTFIQLIGESVANTIIYYDDPATVLGTQNSASFTVNANDFSAINITFANTFGDGSQAVAVLINADRAAFKNCRFLGNQDTLYTKGSGNPRHYFKNCYIDGNVDFIFGSSIALFDSCVIYAKTRPATTSSYITAANTTTGQAYGYVFKDCVLPSNVGNTKYYLGRPWNNATAGNTAFNQTVYLNSTFGTNLIQPAGWTTWDAGTITAQTNYAEYKNKNFDGTLADVSARVAWSKQLTDLDAANYTMSNLFGSWNPCTVYPGFCDYVQPAIAISNFMAVKGPLSSAIVGNISWPMIGIRYQLFRSTDNANFTQIAESTSTTDSVVNYGYIDALPPANTIYYYYVLATKPGYAGVYTDTVLVSSKPTIVSSNTALGDFAQGIGIPSKTQSYTLSGYNLTDNVTITPPAGFEVSADDGATWFTNASPLVLTPVANALAATVIKVRLNAIALGNYSGNITHVSLNADNVNVAVNGTTSSTPPEEIVTLQSWPLTVNNQDDITVRSVGVIASTPTFNKMAVSNGTSAPTVPDYSDKFGQAFSPGTLGDGLWSTGSGGPGSNLNRTIYEQFTITAAPGQSVKVDSLVMLAAFYNSASNTKLAVVYSKNGFGSPADSTDISGTDSSGTTMSSDRYGAFLKPIFIANQTGGPISRYAFVLNGSTGITLAAGETLSIRLYFSCGSSSSGRYATIKNVLAKGVVLNTVPVHLLSFTGGNNANKVALQWITVNEINTSKFIVERSNDGKNFAVIGNVEAKNTGNKNSYTFNDDKPLTGTGFYRLKTIDIDGRYSYSAILRIGTSNNRLLGVYPNPVINEMVVTYPISKEQAIINIVSLNGKNLRTQNLAKQTSPAVINVSGLNAGLYIMQYKNTNGENYSVKFVKR